MYLLFCQKHAPQMTNKPSFATSTGRRDNPRLIHEVLHIIFRHNVKVEGIKIHHNSSRHIKIPDCLKQISILFSIYDQFPRTCPTRGH